MNIKPSRQKPNGKQSAYKERRKKTPKKITETYLHNSGLYYLQRYAASSKHFHRVMMRKVKKSCAHHIDQDLEKCRAWVDALVETFERTGLLNDEIYSRAMVTTLRRQGKSARAIHAKLAEKGLRADQIETAMAEREDEAQITPHNAELKAALILSRKRKIGAFWPPHKDSDETIHQKSLGILARAGFSFDIAKKALAYEEEEARAFIGGLR